MLACSLNEVDLRISQCGSHTASFVQEVNGGIIADAFREGIYSIGPERNNSLGLSKPEFEQIVHANHLMWAPDGDEAFEDRSGMLQFHVGPAVRIIGFRSSEDGCRHEPGSLRDVWDGLGQIL